MLFAGVILPRDHAYADDMGYTTESFDVEAVASEDYRIHVEETITVDFKEQRHGIYRYIPERPKFYTLDNIGAEGGPVSLETDSESEDENGTYWYQVLRIGSPYEFVQGKKTYKIYYDIVGKQDPSKDEDYLSLDILSTSWETWIGSSTLKLTMPKKIAWDDFAVTYGRYGSTSKFRAGESEGAFTSVISKDGKTITIKGRDIPAREGVSLYTSLDEGYWVGAEERVSFRLLIMLVPVLGLLIMFLLWLFNGRDPRVPEPVEFYAPDGLTPAEVGYIVDGRLDDKDLSSMIMYFASKKYIEIREIGESKNKKNARYELIKKADNEALKDEPAFARTIYAGLFKGAAKTAGPEGTDERVVPMDALPESFAEDIGIAKDQIKSLYDSGEKRMFTARSKAARSIGNIISILPIAIVMGLTALMNYMYFSSISAIVPFLFAMVGVMVLNSAFDRIHSTSRVSNVASFVIGILVIIASLFMAGSFMLKNEISLISVVILAVCVLGSVAFEILMWARTKENALVLGKVLGFRNFIEKAEYNRLKELSEENPEYYYDVLPYAFVMGMSVTWAKKFEELKIPEPEWYHGASDTMMWNSMMYYNMMNSCSTQFSSQSVVIDTSDTGGIFTGGGFSGGGGGGFSGGGFGGGGGGAW